MGERRGGTRIRTFLRGRIVYNNRASTMDCLVRDLSINGARLALSEGMALPETFDLVVPHKDATYRCSLRWRRPGEVGVVFDIPVPVSPRAAISDPDALHVLVRLRQLELENEELRARVAELTGEAVSAA